MSAPGLPPSVRVIVRDWLCANHVLLRGPQDNVLVDTGYVRRVDRTLELLQHPNALGARHLHRIINTHGHSDHIGGNAALQRVYGCRIAVPAGEAALIRQWDTRGLWLDYAGQEAERFMYEEVIAPGETVDLGGLSWEAGAAPGHDMGALVLLSGDWTGLAFPVYSLVGGKWTSFRAFSEQTADKALEFLDVKRTKDTHSLAIGGGRGYLPASADMQRQIESLSAWTGVTSERLRGLFERYGTRAEAIATFINGGNDRPLTTLPDYSLREVLFIVAHEKVFRLDDFLLRRSMLAMLGQVTREMLDELAEVLASALGWTKAQRAAEVARTLSILANRNGLVLSGAEGVQSTAG